VIHSNRHRRRCEAEIRFDRTKEGERARQERCILSLSYHSTHTDCTTRFYHFFFFFFSEGEQRMTTALWLSKRLISSTSTTNHTANGIRISNKTFRAINTHSLRNLGSTSTTRPTSLSSYSTRAAAKQTLASNSAVSTAHIAMCRTQPTTQLNQGSRRNFSVSSAVLGLVVLVLSVVVGRKPWGSVSD
jgi:hypothetical protein